MAILTQNTLIALLLAARVCTREELSGCSQRDIAQLEASAGIPLPRQYSEFLCAMGHGAGAFFQGTEIFFAALDGLRNRAVDLLAENGENFCLPTDAFVFAMHQGYEFNYFLLSQGENPAVYQYVEGRGNPVLTWKTLSEFLSDAIAAHAQPKC